MSYEIIYNKQFIKATKGNQTVFLPMILMGSNNTFEVNWRTGGNGRRARNWNNMTYILGGKQFGTAEEILESVDKYRSKVIASNESYTYEGKSEYSDDSFGWFASLAISGKHTSATTFNAFKNIFVNGIKNALTIEQLREEGIVITVSTSPYSTDKLKEMGLKGILHYPKTTQELLSTIEESEALLKGVISLYVTMGASDMDMKILKQIYYPSKAKTLSERKPVTEFFKVTINNGYFHKKTKYGLQYSYTDGKRFKTEKLAQAMANKLIAYYGDRKGEIKVVKVELEEPIYI